jgi:hypothetical protein
MISLWVGIGWICCGRGLLIGGGFSGVQRVHLATNSAIIIVRKLFGKWACAGLVNGAVMILSLSTAVAVGHALTAMSVSPKVHE